MQRALDAGAVVGIELAGALIHVIDLGPRHFRVAQGDLALHIARSGHAAQVQDDFEQVLAVVRFFHRAADIRGENFEQGFEVVGYF